jgi:hypothetical protein
MYKNGFCSNRINFQEIANSYDMSFSMSESPPNKTQERSPSPINRPHSTRTEPAPAFSSDFSLSSSSQKLDLRLELSSENLEVEQHSSSNQQGSRKSVTRRKLPVIPPNIRRFSSSRTPALRNQQSSGKSLVIV